jgi:hypothetical protein
LIQLKLNKKDKLILLITIIYGNATILL